MPGSQDFAADSRNANLKVWLNGKLVAKDEAKVSIFDAGFVLGDGVWEGLRLHKGALLFLDVHLDRLYAGARDIDLDIGLTRDQVKAALEATLAANSMHHGAHLRLMATRGLKTAVNQDPRNALGPATIAIVAEYKEPSPEIATKGLSLATSSIRCTPADMFDMRLNSHSRLPLIRALLGAIKAGADEALMLDPGGFVSSCNATNFFWVKDGEVRTSTGEFCFNGVTRGAVIRLCDANQIPLRLDYFRLEDVHGADEALMLDPGGFVSSCNATNFFWVKDGEVRTSTGDFCFNGVTRGAVIRLCDANQIPIRLDYFRLADVHAANEAFVTGTFGGILPVRQVDGHVLPGGTPGPLTAKLRGLYEALKDEQAFYAQLNARP